MYFPKFWVRVQQGAVHAWGWSDVSEAEAQTAGQARLARVLERLGAGREPSKWVDPYGYPDRPMREEVIHQFAEGDGDSVVTRNSYGSLVLNTSKALFADVDENFQPVATSLFSLFRKKPSLDEVIQEKARNWVELRKDWGWRIYRTKAGYRLLATHRPISPDDPVTEEVFQEFKADRLYRKLCVNQKCFRARLTPKSWRCGMDRISQRWPWLSREDEAAFREWEKTYREATAEYSTCRLLGQVGNGAIHPDLAALVEFHDKATGVGSDRPLA
jgi:hypothetical protein